MQTGNDNSPQTRPAVFLSYSRTDQPRARQVIDLLEAGGFDVWWDGRLEGGENYLQTTEAALEGADCVVVLWSVTSVVATRQFAARRAFAAGHPGEGGNGNADFCNWR